jgi:hypothetical protein
MKLAQNDIKIGQFNQLDGRTSFDMIKRLKD